ncbi:hypothetical protein C5N99_11780 [Treponema medium]|uniref:Uncharacterized protein n=2 Tax=Treponema medium TaxID=58231 RepID=A0AA87TDZ9_TREMD|nr:hypothetical protein [Treponema medium]EPF27674.1 hypothetical protein HMPREF9195_02172 [Treponema medium ATCC 700293]QSH93250.1 hypothetical protein C5N99_11780 [Treponema medium]QSH98268.1 hypothetical protein DWB79_11025 [Treponema medium]
MKRIFKYTFLQRLPSIILSCAVMACMSGVELLFVAFTKNIFNGFYMLWFVLTVIVLTVIPLFLFIRCSSGYARTLLFTNESYLMLTLPVRTEFILLGRILCGLAELVICMVISGFFLIAVGIGWTYHYIGFTSQQFFRVTEDILTLIFLKNFPLIVLMLFGSLVSFILIGNVALAVQTVMRSFNIKRMRGVWTVGFILIFTGTLFLTGRIEAMAGRALGSYCPITVYGIQYAAQVASYPGIVINVPIVSTLISLGIGIACFFASAWLLKRKVEV